MRLAHLHIPNITPFSRVSQIQETLTSRLLASKNHHPHHHGPAQTTPLDPTIITFTPNPVYTTGRRDLPPSNTRNNANKTPASGGGGASQSQLSLPSALEPIRSILTPPSTNPNLNFNHPSGRAGPIAEYHPTLRGGQTTYHGPGQMVGYTILDLRRMGLTPRCHIRVLEDSVVDVLGGFGVRGVITDDPGVWVSSQPTGTGSGARGGEAMKKITAVGVHLRRNISSFGIGFNVTEEPMGYFSRIVACGLEGREATSLEGVGVSGVGVEDVAGRFVSAFVRRVNRVCSSNGSGNGERVEGVYRIGEDDIDLD